VDSKNLFSRRLATKGEFDFGLSNILDHAYPNNVGNFAAHSKSIFSIFSVDGVLATGSFDRSVRVTKYLFHNDNPEKEDIIPMRHVSLDNHTG